MNESTIAVKGRYKVKVLEADRVVQESDWQPNLILDQGLDKFATVRIADCFLYACCGTDNTPVKDTPAPLVTWGGTTLTAAAAIWSNLDIGKLVVFVTGQQCYITGYTDSTHVTVDRSNTIPSGTAIVMYHVNQTKLNAEIYRSNTYSQNQGDNSTTRNGAVITFQRTFLFPIETGAGHTYFELGWSNGSIMGQPDIFARVVLSPGVQVNGPVGNNPGQQLLVIYQLIVGFGPSSQMALPPTQNITGLPRSYAMYQVNPIPSGFEILINNWVQFFVGDRIVISGTSSPYDNAPGTYYSVAAITQGPSQSIIAVNASSHGTLGPGAPSVGTLTGYMNMSQIAQDYGIAIVDPSGITTIGVGQILSGEPSQLGQIWTADFPFNPSSPIGQSTSAPSYNTAAYTLGTYTGKSFTISKNGSFPATGSFNFVALGLGIPDTQANQVLRVDCGQRQSKLGGETLTLTFTQSWIRSFT
jgi:hypothetical protein